MGGLIVLVGIVQYRSSLEVSRATGQRLTDSLQMSIMSWQLNFFRELADICLRLRLDADRIDGPELEEAVSRFQTRQATVDFAELAPEEKHRISHRADAFAKLVAEQFG